MPVPLLVLRSEGRRQGGQRTVAAPAAGTAVEERRRAACGRKAVHCPSRFPADLTPKSRRNVMERRRRFFLTAAASALVLALSAATAWAQRGLIAPPVPETPPPVPPILQNYKPVTPDRLKQPEDDDWLMYRRTYDGWGDSPLAEITSENANRLKPVWTLATGQVEGHQAPPMVNNGVMFVATPGNQGLALDAKNGDILGGLRRP